VKHCKRHLVYDADCIDCMDVKRRQEDADAEIIRRMFPNATKSTKRRNPELYGGNAVGAGKITSPERNKVLPLVGAVKAQRQRTGQVVICVTFLACRHRELDSDSNVYSIKPLRDAVAATLGIDDADARVRWQYAQVQTRGQEGVLVRIETI